MGVDGANVAYSAGVETGIQSGQLAGKIPLVPGTQQGTLQGLISTMNGGLPPAGVSVAVQAEALQQIAGNGTTITVPLLPSQSPFNEAMLTTNGFSCPSGVDCAPFAMQLPSNAPNVVACSEQTAQFTQQGTTPAYIADSSAEIPGSGGTPACTAGSMQAPGGARCRPGRNRYGVKSGIQSVPVTLPHRITGPRVSGSSRNGNDGPASPAFRLLIPETRNNPGVAPGHPIPERKGGP